MPPPIAVDLRPCADGSTVRTALVACKAIALPIAYGAAGLGQLGQTDGRIAVSLNAPYGGGHNNSVLMLYLITPPVTLNSNLITHNVTLARGRCPPGLVISRESDIPWAGEKV